MKLLQIIFLLLFLLINVSAIDFKEVRIIKLKKDVQKKILVSYGSNTKLFQFRWTLYKNNALVLFRSYDKIVAQNILYTSYKNRFFRQELKSRGANLYNVPYILVKFKEFDYETREAIFELFLSDNDGQINLKYLKD